MESLRRRHPLSCFIGPMRGARQAPQLHASFKPVGGRRSGPPLTPHLLLQEMAPLHCVQGSRVAAAHTIV
jgi:hypothetical protein